jgi:hypothetical protein
MLYLLLFEEKKRKEKKRKEKKEIGEMARELYSPGQTHPIGCAMLGFSLLFGAIKSCF